MTLASKRLHTKPAVEIAQQIIGWSAQLVWPRTARRLLDRVLQTGSGAIHSFFTLGRIEIQFKSLSRRLPFDQLDMRRLLQEKLNAIAGVSIPDERLDSRPSLPLAA